MNHLWAPWRSKYVVSAAQKRNETCIFCEATKTNDDRSSYVVFRGKKNFVILNAFPYNPGHIMIAPYRHIGTLEALDAEESLEMFELVKASLRILRKVYNPDGFNIGVNIGRAAGAGIESHVHVHVVPRWNGDANFMPVVAGTKVLPESLDDTYKKLKAAFDEEMKKSSITEK